MNAPRVTLEGIKAKIKDVQFFVMPDGRTTICHATLENNFTVRGESACVGALNFDAEIGRNMAYEDAIEKIWPLEGYLLAESIFRAEG